MISRPFAPLLGALPLVGPRLKAMLDLAPRSVPPRSEAEPGRSYKVSGTHARRVAILSGCAQPVLNPMINDATIRLLNRHQVEVVLPKGEGCCGALVHHMGQEHAGHVAAKRNIDAWMAEIDGAGLDAILITASGCGTTIKDYGFMLRDDPAYAEKAARVSAAARDVSEYLATLDLPTIPRARKIPVAYHSACSLQHGQQIREEPKRLLRAAGFDVRDVPEGHICCGSAGVYNIMQPEIAGRLKARKLANIARVRPRIVATGNIGCITQLSAGSAIPVAHTVELIDWAQGGPQPPALDGAGFYD
jgi:glycolate oxidase iron-sulfur subunit